MALPLSVRLTVRYFTEPHLGLRIFFILIEVFLALLKLFLPYNEYNAIVEARMRSQGQRIHAHEFPPWQTVYHYFRAWRMTGLWEQIHGALRERARVLARRDVQPSACIIDSQSVKTTERGGVHGYDGGKKAGGRKRHILVDTTGLLLKARVHAAGIADRDGARLLLEGVGHEFPRLEHVWADMDYRGKVVEWIKERLDWTVEIVKQPRRWFRVPEGEEVPFVPAFVVLPRRWVVERTFAWVGCYRRMSKDYEYLTETSEATIYAAMLRLLLKRLAKVPAQTG